MEKHFLTMRLPLITGTILVSPTVYFICAAILYFGLGNSFLWIPIDPILENQANKHIGWNMNLLIMPGSVMALAYNFLCIVKVSRVVTSEKFQLSIIIRKQWLNIAVAILSILVLSFLFGYPVIKNYGELGSVHLTPHPHALFSNFIAGWFCSQ